MRNIQFPFLALLNTTPVSLFPFDVTTTMAQYLTARWDYIAEGDFELSFKEGDLIKLLEKHNDDW
jgi:hypothetical protein